MDLDLAVIMVWLFLWLSLGVFGMLMTLTLANTLSAIKADKKRKRPIFNLSHLLQRWSKRIPFQSLGHQLAFHGSAETSTRTTLASYLPPLACDLEVKSAPLCTDCCLLHTKQGSSLHGGAISTRLTRLRRLGVLL